MCFNIESSGHSVKKYTLLGAAKDGDIEGVKRGLKMFKMLELSSLSHSTSNISTPMPDLLALFCCDATDSTSDSGASQTGLRGPVTFKNPKSQYSLRNGK